MTRWRRLIREARRAEWMLLIALAGALAAVALSLFLRAFYRYDATGYEPKDLQRGLQLERQQGADRSGQ